MIEFSKASPVLAARRRLFGRLAGSAAVGVAGLMAVSSGSEAAVDTMSWPGKLKGRHRQVVDAVEPNDGYPLAFALTFLMPNTPGTASAVVVLRHAAFPFALNSAMWEKYKIGESMKIMDPETKKPAVKNPFIAMKPGVLPIDFALDTLVAKGVIFGGCNVALKVLSGKLSGNAGMTPDEAAKEWAANIVPGVTIIPSGTWGVNRAQEAGCTYCYGG